MDERIVSKEELEMDNDNSIRPLTLSEYIGQSEVKENIPLETIIKITGLSK